MSEASLRGKAAIIGIGQSPVGNVPGAVRCGWRPTPRARRSRMPG